MFGMGDFFDDFDEFTSFLEQDTVFMRKMFRDLGRDVRLAPGKRRKQKRGGKGHDDLDAALGFGSKTDAADLDAMLSFFMMPGMFTKSKPPKKTKKAKKPKAEEDDGWNTEEEELDAEDRQ